MSSNFVACNGGKWRWYLQISGAEHLPDGGCVAVAVGGGGHGWMKRVAADAPLHQSSGAVGSGGAAVAAAPAACVSHLRPQCRQGVDVLGAGDGYEQWLRKRELALELRRVVAAPAVPVHLFFFFFTRLSLSLCSRN